MPNPASTNNVMTVTLKKHLEGPRLKLSPDLLRIRKGSGPGRFDRITLDYPAPNQETATALQASLDPDGTKGLPADGRIRFTLSDDTGIFTEPGAGGAVSFELSPGQRKTLVLRPTLGIQPGGSFETHPDVAIARVVTLKHEFPGVTDPGLTLARTNDGNHVDWHVEC